MRFMLRHVFLIIGVTGLIGAFAFEEVSVFRVLVLPQYIIWQLMAHLRVAMMGPSVDPGVLNWLLRGATLLAGLAPYALLDAFVGAALRESVAPRST